MHGCQASLVVDESHFAEGIALVKHIDLHKTNTNEAYLGRPSEISSCGLLLDT